MRPCARALSPSGGLAALKAVHAPCLCWPSRAAAGQEHMRPASPRACPHAALRPWLPPHTLPPPHPTPPYPTPHSPIHPFFCSPCSVRAALLQHCGPERGGRGGRGVKRRSSSTLTQRRRRSGSAPPGATCSARVPRAGRAAAPPLARGRPATPCLALLAGRRLVRRISSSLLWQLTGQQEHRGAMGGAQGRQKEEAAPHACSSCSSQPSGADAPASPIARGLEGQAWLPPLLVPPLL